IVVVGEGEVREERVRVRVAVLGATAAPSRAPCSVERHRVEAVVAGRGRGAKLCARCCAHAHRPLKYSCTNWTAIEPSPTAEATRLIEPERTSPAANTPGR